MLGREGFKESQEFARKGRRNTYDKNADLPTSASPNNKIVTSGVSAMLIHLQLSPEKI
jgi:hypothetical protein